MLYIITAVHNRYDITRRFVLNLKKQIGVKTRLILVDDGSTDGTAEMVKKELPNSVILSGKGNLWWGGALDKAYRYLIKKNPKNCNAVMIVNDDAEISRDYLKIGYMHLQKHPKDLITGCGYSINDGSLKDGPVNYDCKTGTVKRLNCGEEGNCATTRSLMMSFSSFKDIGGFHPILLPHYGSDYEYTIRAHKKGKRILSFDDFTYKFDEGTTGYNTLKNITLKQIFSKRSRFNPFYRIILMFMITPIKYVPSNLFCGIKRAFLEKYK